MGAASVRCTSRGKNFRNGDEESFLFFLGRETFVFGGAELRRRGSFARPRKVEALHLVCSIIPIAFAVGLAFGDARGVAHGACGLFVGAWRGSIIRNVLAFGISA